MAMEAQNQRVVSSGSGPPAVRAQPAPPARPNSDSRPVALSSNAAKPPTPSVYDMDIDDELLSAFADELEEADFSQPKPSVSNPKTQSCASGGEPSVTLPSRKPIATVGRPAVTKNTSQSAAKSSRTIDSWFKSSRNMDSGNGVKTEKSVTREVNEITVASPPRTMSTAQSSYSTRPTLRVAAPVSQDSGCPDDDVICLDDDFAPTFRESIKKPQKPAIREAKRAKVQRKIADVVEAIARGELGQTEEVEVKAKIQRVIKSLKIENGEWVMTVEIIADGSMPLEVSMSSPVSTDQGEPYHDIRCI